MLTTGVDVVQISRIARAVDRFGERFLDRVYTPQELAFTRKQAAELAARFAAKEAVSKALGVGVRVLSPRGILWREVETLNERSGKPYVRLHGSAAELAAVQGLTEWAISLSHDGDMAIAFVVAM
ncbi:MAG TPA: holo-ACP synthase [Anaerolineae bacterium]|nr:holo-ACP synthase [Anaerolineae bacterium]